MSIARLPEELILYIHFLAENPFLPLVHPTIYHNLHFASKRYIARYLYSLHRLQGPSVLVWSLRHPICTIEVAQEIAKLWQDDHDTPLTCPTLPTRLFRQPGTTTTVPPLLEYLFDHYSPSPNDPSGYPLSRSVLSKNEALIRYLLSKGAHPGVRGGLAVRTAVQIKRLDLVRLLVEPASTTEADVQEQGQVNSKKRIASDSDGRTAKSPKRQRREDRYKVGSELVELAMNAGADDIVQYFVSDKGVMPPLKSIMSMGKQRLFKAKRVA